MPLPSEVFYPITLSILSFFFFGFSCFISPYMKKEFIRYGLPSYRRMVGFLQILGAAALLLGLYYTFFGIMGAAGLSILMFMGVLVRIKIKDGWLKAMPALFYAILNFYIAAFLFFV